MQSTEANEFALGTRQGAEGDRVDQLISQKLAEAEAKVDRSTEKFLRILMINFLTLACFSVGILMVLYNFLSFKYVVLGYGLYDIILIFTIIQKTLKRIKEEANLQQAISTHSSKEKRIWKRLATDTLFLDCMGRGLTCASYFLVELLPGLFYSICIGPMAICTLWVVSLSIYSAFKAKSE